MSRRLLVLAYFFPPLSGGGVHRALSFVRHLPEHGWDCTVVCAGGRDYWVHDASLLAQVPASTEVLRVQGGSALSTWLRLRGGEGRRRAGTFAGLRSLSDWWLLPDSYAGWAGRAARAVAARIARGGIDALLSTSPPDSVHLAAERALARRRVPWVADFRDPWIGTSFRTPPTAWHRARHVAMERRVLESADLVLAASRTHADALRAGGVSIRALEHLPNGFEPAPRGGAVAGDEHFRIVYTGTLSLMPDAEALLEAVHDLLAHTPGARRKLRVDIAGPFDLEYEDRAVALGLRGIVRFTGPLAHAESRALQRRADVLVLWKPRGDGYRTMVPGKLYEYLDSGRPVLAVLPEGDEAAALVRRAGGEVVAPGHRPELARALETRYMAWSGRGRLPDHRPEWLDEHARSNLASRLATRLDSLLGGSS
ncbi:MAG TPA: glycosyltransferase [Candidatus Acidoferrales bacterium]|nr:glycosyltransferase [Candidatus Acidoferrales bacterium]